MTHTRTGMAVATACTVVGMSLGIALTGAFVPVDNDSTFDVASNTHSTSALSRDSHSVIRPTVVTETVEVEVPAEVTASDVAAFIASLPACATEDSTDCYWDADTQGNGDGVSFIDIAGQAYYLELETVEVPGETVQIPGPVEYVEVPVETIVEVPVEVPAPVEMWNGFTVGEVILCPAGMSVADDVTPEGQTWAACM